MAFSDGQLLFAAIFFVIFTIAIGWAYFKDIRQTKNYSKHTWKVLIAIAIIFSLFYATVRML